MAEVRLGFVGALEVCVGQTDHGIETGGPIRREPTPEELWLS